ncbi:MAG: glycosyltransferase family 4 protein [Bacteroidia bacterium]|nr:glycosyltransferase family 4 protein [Bacteroidia bacterium]
MNILYLDHYAGSPTLGMQFRPYYLSKEWIKQGHKVTIVAASYSHLRTTQPITKNDLDEDIIDGITYIWINTPEYHSSGIKRILNILTYVIKLFKYSNRLLLKTSPDAVIASSTYPLDIYPAFRIAKKCKAKLVFELHDLWPLSPMLIGGYSQYHPFIWLLQKAENFACRKSDCVVSILGNTKDHLILHGLKSEKFFHVPNGFSENELNFEGTPIPEEHEELLQRLNAESNLIIGYAGGHAPSNALKSFVLASKYFENTSTISFVLVGNGNQKNELMQIAKNNNQKNIYFLPSVNKTSIPQLLLKFDLLYAGGTSSILHQYGTSYNKITDYMLAEKPIIFAVDEPNCLVERVGCGIQIPAENKTKLIEAIQLLSNYSQEEREEMGKKGRQYALSNLNYTSLSIKIIEVIENP